MILNFIEILEGVKEGTNQYAYDNSNNMKKYIF